MVRQGLIIETPPRQKSHGVNDDGCSESVLSQSDISDDYVEEGEVIMAPVWQHDGEEDEEEGGGGAFIRHDLEVNEGFNCPQPIPLDLPALEISFSLCRGEEQPSPSSVSCQNTVELPAVPIPALPRDYVSLESATRMPPYRMRWQRRVEALKRRASYDLDADMAHAQRPTLHQHTSPSLQASSSSSSSFPLQQEQLSGSGIRSIQGRRRTLSFASPRLLMTLCAFALLILSIHDRADPSPRFVSDARVEEVAFPLSKQQKANLPKYYLPTTTSAATSATSGNDKGTGGDKSKTRERLQSQQRQIRRSNLAMARPEQQARPVFVPDDTASGSHSSMKRERFVFDTEQQRQTQNQHQGTGGTPSTSRRRPALSWTSWLASVALVGMLIDTGCKEYQKCRRWDEQRRL